MEEQRDRSQQKRDLLWCIASLAVLYTVGGCVFSFLERSRELEQYRRNELMYDRMQELYRFSHCSEPFFSHMEFCKNQERFDDRLSALFQRSGNGFEDQQRWTFLGSIFFVNSLVTTIGYGSMYPRTNGGMLFTIVFGILGIPVMAYTLRLLATLIGDAVQSLVARESPKGGETTTTLILGSVFLFGGALVFVFLEDWSYIEAIYFTVITLTSIGFGDYLPSSTASRVFTMFFIILGLGTASSMIKTMMISCESSTEPLVTKIGDSYATFVNDCECCTGDRAEQTRQS
jgi:hypothetical protein